MKKDLLNKLERQRNNLVKLRYRFAMQKVGSGVVAVAIEEDALKYNEILRMNSTGAFILEQLQNGISYIELEKGMLQKYDTNIKTVKKILVDFLGVLSEKEILLDDKGRLISVNSIRENASLY